jgi:acetone monooxygenase (methyl acetate-forming)
MAEVAEPSAARAAANHGNARTLDAVIIGAGVAGLYQLHQLRQQGLNVRLYDTASDVGGTWYWNRYPGAKFDSEAYIYQYFFDEKLYKDWSWSERFPGQAEIQRWLQYVTERLDLRRDIQFSTTIASATYDDARGRWRIVTAAGEQIDTQFFITCGGMLSAPMEKLFAGQDTFKGRIFHTGRWPKEALDLSDKRVGVVGIGATGIQVIQTIADKVKHLKVFVRTPQYVLPMKNPQYSANDVAAYKARFDELHSNLPNTFTGFEYDFTHQWAKDTPEQRRAVLEEIYADGSLKLWLASYGEMFFDEKVSEEVSEFVREKMRARLKDKRLCDLLIPKEYGFGTHRVPLEMNYLEAYLRPNVEAVSVKANPIQQIVPQGIQLADGTVHELDVIILATGFDAGTGALTRIDIRGRDGRSLRDEWFTEIRTTMGLAKHGYPNMLTTAVPLAPSAALCNMATCLQQQTEWITGLIGHMNAKGAKVVEPTAQLEDAWVRHHDETANATLISKTSSWYVGSNVPGKPRRVLSYTGGVGEYKRRCDEMVKTGYAGFEMR